MDVDATATAEQAKKIVRLLPAIMRQLFTRDDDPAAELPLAQLRVCGILQFGGRAMSALSRELGVSLSALTQIADRLERAGLVDRVAEKNDRRIRCLQLTQRGQQIMRLQEEYRIERTMDALNRMSPDERADVLAALDTLSETCAGMKSQEIVVQ